MESLPLTRRRVFKVTSEAGVLRIVAEDPSLAVNLAIAHWRATKPEWDLMTEFSVHSVVERPSVLLPTKEA